MAALCYLTCPAGNRADYATHEGRWETTNRHFYVDLPAEKRMVKPEYYNTAADRTHHIHAALAHEAAEDSRAAGLQEGPCGRAGARGEPHIRSQVTSLGMLQAERSANATLAQSLMRIGTDVVT
jgi:hypothetical protein